MLQPSHRCSAWASLATPLIFQKYSNMPGYSLWVRPTDAFTKDKGDAYAGNGVFMVKCGFDMKKKPKKKPAPAVAPQKQGRGQPQKRQPNKNYGPSLTTARLPLTSEKPPSTDAQPHSTDIQLQYTATQPPPTAAEPTSTPRSSIPMSTPAADNPPASKNPTLHRRRYASTSRNRHTVQSLEKR